VGIASPPVAGSTIVLKNLIMGKEVSCKGQPPTPARETSCQEGQKYDAICLTCFNSSIYLIPAVSSDRHTGACNQDLVL
jgi:hypothetical protein